ncbi:MAG: TonB family protein, partial [Archangium sp.]|nr:TonB family protein [Archangium sp.]
MAWGLFLCARLALAHDDGGVDDIVPPALLEALPLSAPDGGAPGDVDVALTVDGSGAVIDVQLRHSPDEALAAEALSVARRLRFRPATRGGEPIAVVIDFRFHFAAPVVPDAGPPMARITGQLLTKGTREPVPSAVVMLSGTELNTFSDTEGHFTLEVPAGRAKLEVKAPGHRPKTFPEVVGPGVELKVVYRLEPEFGRPYETIVRGQADRAEVSRVHLTGAELTEVAGTGGEPLRVVMVLPGVTTPASGLSYPVVRGALPAATGFFIDGVRIPQLYHLLLGPSVIHPDFIEAIDFFPANAPTRFGRITGGVVSAQVSKPRTDRVHVTAYADLINAGAFAEVPIQKTGTSITVAGRVSYSGWLLAALAGALAQQSKPVVDFYDYQARVEQRLGAGTLRLLAFGSSDLVGARDSDITRPSAFVTSRFHRIDLRAQYPLGPGQLEAGGNVGWETLGLFAEQNGGRIGAFLMDRFVLTGRVQYRVELGSDWQFKAGADVERQLADVETTTEIAMMPSVFRPPRAVGVFGGPFAEVGFFHGPWSVVAGVRADAWHLVPDVTQLSVEPRLDARYVVNETVTVRATAGLAHQAPLLLISLPVVDVAALRDGLHQVGQFSAGAQVALPLKLQLSVDGYFNPIFQARERSLRQFVSGISSLDDRFTGGRTGRAYG